MPSLLLLVAGVTNVASFTAVTCVPAVAGIPAAACVSDIAGVPGSIATPLYHLLVGYYTVDKC
jgi:hypothetical protein